jgi:hypothetical protein
MQTPDYCREIERYLCQKNDGHLIRVVGPSFDLVSRWAADGVPLKVAFRGIDRCVERYYKKGPRRRPVRIDFCEADVLDVFDEWRRSTGLVSEDNATARERPRSSLPDHLERVVLKLSNACASAAFAGNGEALGDLTTRVSRELDAARTAGGVRGDARKALVARLSALDVELQAMARGAIDESTRTALEREADEELAAFRERMPADAYARAHAAVMDRLVRERLGFPTITL